MNNPSSTLPVPSLMTEGSSTVVQPKEMSESSEMRKPERNTKKINVSKNRNANISLCKENKFILFLTYTFIHWNWNLILKKPSGIIRADQKKYSKKWGLASCMREFSHFSRFHVLFIAFWKSIRQIPACHAASSD